jgi:hypothetical protein
MTAYQATLAVHVLAAVLGLGNIVAVAVLVPGTAATASAPGSAVAPAPGLTAQLRRLLGLAGGALLLLIASGAVLMYFTRGLYVQMTWFRAATVMVLALGPTLGIARRGLRPPKSGAPGPLPRDPLARTRRATLVACGLAAAVVFLMVTKP